jgi:hypothetical protein
MSDTLSRRLLVKQMMIAGTVIPIVGILRTTVSIAGASAVDPADPMAKALQYVLQSAKPDAKCGNCSQYQGKADDAQGPCAIFPGKTVTAAGWCVSWTKKAAT